VSEGNHAQHERDSEKGIEGAVEHVPEGDVEAADLPELVGFVAYEANGEDVQQALDNIKITCRVDGVDGARVESEVNKGEGNLHPVLVAWDAHTVWVQMRPVACVGLVLEVDEAAGVFVVLHDPTAPEVVDALLVSRRADDGNGMKVDCLLDSVRRRCGLAVDEGRVPLEQHLFEEVVHVFLGFDEALRHHLSGNSAHIVQVGIPELGSRLLLEPLLHHQQAEDNASLVLLSTGRCGRV